MGKRVLNQTFLAMNKFIFLFIALFYFISANPAYLRNIPPIKQKQFDEEVNYSDTITLSEITETAMAAVNSFEDYREFPDSVSSGKRKYPIHQLLKVYADAIIAIEKNGDTLFTINNAIDLPSDLYINIEPDSSVYEIPLMKSEYLDFCSKIQNDISGLVQLPNLFDIRNSQIRTVEAIYLLASIIRYYQFFDDLPEFAQVMLTPKGLVPWELSNSQRTYTSMNNGTGISNNFYNVGKFEPYKIARKIVGNESNAYNAGKLIYDHVIKRWYESGYYLWIKPFGEPDYAYSNYRFNRSNSASQSDKINMLLRSVGLPCTGIRMYDENSHDWINIDVHREYGDYPQMDPPWDTAPPLSKDMMKIKRIEGFIKSNNSSAIQDKYIWINPSDIKKYGSDYILTKCKLGGINNIILTVKSSNGYLFYPTQTNYTNTTFELFRFDAISDLAEKAGNYNINILPAVSVLNDQFANYFSYAYPQNSEDWNQYTMGDTLRDHYINTIAVSACAEKYKNRMISQLKEIAKLPNISGIVLSSLYMATNKGTASYLNAPDGNSLCNCYKKDSLWQSILLQKYATDLIKAVKDENIKLKVILSSYPLQSSFYPTFQGMFNQDIMKNLADAYMLIVGYNEWINPNGDYVLPLIEPEPFKLNEYVKKLSINAQKPIVVSISLKDEWIYTPDFYTGLAKELVQAGASGFGFHEFNSLEGAPEGEQLHIFDKYLVEYDNPAFDAFQYYTISSLNFKKNKKVDHPVLETDTTLIDFGNVVIGKSSIKKFLLTNNGNREVLIKRISFSDSVFFAFPDIKDTIVPALGKLIIDLIFKPNKTGLISSNCIIESETDSIIINLKGEGRFTILASAGIDLSVDEGTLVTLSGKDSYVDSNKPLFYKWTAPPGISLNSNTIVNPSFIAPEVKEKSSYTFSLIVYDGTIESPEDQVVISVQNVNKQPVASAGMDQLVNEGAKVTLDGSLSFDPDENPLSYQWSSPDEISLSSDSDVKPTFTATEVNKDSTFIFSLLVNDGIVNSLPATVKVTIKNVLNVGIADVESPNFKIFPNPTTGIVNFEISAVKEKKTIIVVTNLMGSKIFKRQEDYAGKFQIDLSNQVNGIYLLKVIVDDFQYVKKVAIQKE
jgi:hypothetical protein